MKKKIYWILIILISSFFTFYIGEYLYNRILDMIIKMKVIPFYNYSSDISGKYDDIKNNISIFFNNFSLDYFKNFFSLIFNINTLIIISYIIQSIIIIKIFVSIWINGSNYKYKESILAKSLIKFVDFIKKNIISFIEFLKENKKKIILIFMLFSLTGFMLVFEIMLFLIDYLMSMINFKSHLLIINLFKWCLVEIVDFILYKNKFIVVITIIVIYYTYAYNHAFKKLNRLWAAFKKMVSESATVNAIDGEPGAGKTLTLTQASLAATENFLDEYEKSMVEFEFQYPNFNFAKVRLLLKIFYLDFKENELYDVLKYNSNFIFELFNLKQFINTDLARMFFNEYYRGSCIVGLTPINDPYYNSFCRIGSVQSMRFFQKMDSFPYEPDMSLVFPEYDKEFNSHDSKKEVGDDGTFAFFALLSHLLERHGSAWLDCQDKDQGIKRIRAVAGGYYHLEKRKVCMPLSIKIIYKPILWFYNKILKLSIAYIGYRPKTEPRWTVRKKQVKYKRNNLSFLYQSLKYLGFMLNKIVSYLEKFQYFKIYATYATNDEMKNAKMIHYSIPVMNLDHNGEKIYSSTPFKKFYDDLKINISEEKQLKQNLMLLDKWSSLDPDILEYCKTGLRNYAKIINAQFDDKGRKV